MKIVNKQDTKTFVLLALAFVLGFFNTLITLAANSLDTSPPVIILKGTLEMNIDKGTDFEEPGYVAYDNIDRFISKKVVVSGDIDTQKAGKYVRIYTVSDTAGNTKQVQRIVNVLSPSHEGELNIATSSTNIKSDSEVEMAFTTTESTRAVVAYGVEGAYTRFAKVAGGVRLESHSHTFSNLLAGTTYQYILYAKTESGEDDVQKGEFTTPGVKDEQEIKATPKLTNFVDGDEVSVGDILEFDNFDTEIIQWLIRVGTEKNHKLYDQSERLTIDTNSYTLKNLPESGKVVLRLHYKFPDGPWGVAKYNLHVTESSGNQENAGETETETTTIVPQSSSDWDNTVEPPKLDDPLEIILGDDTKTQNMSDFDRLGCEGDAYIIKIPSGKDAIVKMDKNSQKLKYPVWITGGRNVHVLGLDLDLEIQDGCDIGEANNLSRSVKNINPRLPGGKVLRLEQSHTTFIEGVNIELNGMEADCVVMRTTGDTGDREDVVAQQKNRKFHMINSRCTGYEGYDVNSTTHDGIHGDIYQNQGKGTPSELIFENVHVEGSANGITSHAWYGQKLDLFKLRNYYYGHDERLMNDGSKKTLGLVFTAHVKDFSGAKFENVWLNDSRETANYGILRGYLSNGGEQRWGSFDKGTYIKKHPGMTTGKPPVGIAPVSKIGLNYYKILGISDAEKVDLEITSHAPESITQTSAKLRFMGTQYSQAYVEYGTTQNYGSQSRKETSFKFIEHLQILPDLTAGTKYYYKATIIGKDGKEAFVNGNFTTLGNPPSEVGPTVVGWPENTNNNLPYAGIFYGINEGGTGIQNAGIGVESSRRFRAEKTGTVTWVAYNNRTLTDNNIKTRCLPEDPESVWCKCLDAGLDKYTCGYTIGSSYSVGNGGRITIELRTDDGKGFPSKTVLAKTKQFIPMDISKDTWPKFDLDTPAKLIAGQTYHLVFLNDRPPIKCPKLASYSPQEAKNCDTDRGAMGLNGSRHLYQGTDAGNFGPYLGDDSSASLYKRGVNSARKIYPTSIGFYELGYTDGMTTGETTFPYYGNREGTGKNTIGGSKMLRQNFVVEDATRKVNGFWLVVGHNDSVNNKLIDGKLKDSNGTVLASTKIGQALQCLKPGVNRGFCRDRIYADFGKTISLEKGKKYFMEFSGPSGAGFTVMTFETLARANKNNTEHWHNAKAEYSTNGGKTWGASSNRYASTRDVGILFTIEGMPKKLDGESLVSTVQKKNDSENETSGLEIISHSTESISSSSAKLRFKGTQYSQAFVEFGTTKSYGSKSREETSFKFIEHLQILENLQPDTTYYYVATIIGKDLQIASVTGSFTTAKETIKDGSEGGIVIKNSDWKGNKKSMSFGDHSGDRNFQPSQKGDTDAIKVVVQAGEHYGSASSFIFPGGTQEVWMSYCLRPGDNWDASVGGKWPGFAGNSSPTHGGQGGLSSNGKNAWSARGLYGIFDTKNSSVPMGTYLYHTNQKGQYGDVKWWSPNGYFSSAEKVKKNQWISVKQHVIMNKKGQSNGVIESWVNGKNVYSQKNLNFTNNEDFREVYRFWLDVYYGGSAKAKKEHFVYFDQFNYSLGSQDLTHTNCNGN